MFSRRPREGIPAGITAHAQPTLPEWLDPYSANLVAWFDPNHGISLNGSKVSAWANKITGGSAYDMAQGTDARRPTYSATGGRSGGPAVQFVAASDTWLTTAAGALNQPVSVVVVTKLTTEIDNMTLVDGRNGNTRRMYYVADTLNIYAGTNLNDGAGAVAVDTWYKFAGVFNGASSIARRGALSTTGAANTAAADGFVVGTFGNAAGGAPWNGWVESIFIWSRALTNVELTGIFAGLG